MSKILKYKKIIMLALILVAAIICVSASYITEYNKTKVSAETIFTTIEETRTYKDSEEFYKHFEYFHIYASEYKTAHEDLNGNLVNGKAVFTIKSKNAENCKAKNINVSVALAANWIEFQALNDQAKDHSSKNETTIKISNINQIFPAKGKLWFTGADQPTLYVMIKWTENETNRYYTFIELSYDQFIAVPEIPVEPTPTPTPAQ